MPKMNITSPITANYINELQTTNYELIMKNKPNSNPMSKPLVGARPRQPESAKMALILANRGVITVKTESIKSP